MKLACLSGKGGAGKTLVAVNLAAVMDAATYIDCDVEEPNGRVFLKPEALRTESVTTLLPRFDPDKCTGCKACVRFCRFHALMYVRQVPTVFPQVCHSCGGCMLVCPEGAIIQAPRPIGRLEVGKSGNVKVVTGVLDPGEASGVPVIRQALKQAQGFTVIDCPPGSACTVMESVREADLCLLVAEPTAFGFHNFQMVHELAVLLGKPCGVVINRQEAPYGPLEDYCRQQALPILARIPYDPRIATMAAGGQLVCREDLALGRMFRDLAERIRGGL